MLASRSAVVFFFCSVDMEKGVVSPARGLTKQKGMVGVGPRDVVLVVACKFYAAATRVVVPYTNGYVGPRR